MPPCAKCLCTIGYRNRSCMMPNFAVFDDRYVPTREKTVTNLSSLNTIPSTYCSIRPPSSPTRYWRFPFHSPREPNGMPRVNRLATKECVRNRDKARSTFLFFYCSLVFHHQGYLINSSVYMYSEGNAIQVITGFEYYIDILMRVRTQSKVKRLRTVLREGKWGNSLPKWAS